MTTTPHAAEVAEPVAVRVARTLAPRFRPAAMPPRVSLLEVRGVLGASALALIGVLFVWWPAAAIALAVGTACASAYAWPIVTMSIILALTPIQNDLGGDHSPVRFAPAELAMFLAAPAALAKVAFRPRIGPVLLPTLFYLGICVVASLGAVRGNTIVSMSQMLLYLVLAVGVFSNLDDRPARLARVFDLYIISGTLMAVAGLLTDFQFLGTHKNGWGASLSTAVIVATDQWFAAGSRRRRFALVCALMVITTALVMTVSRGGWLAAAAGIFVVCTFRGHYRAMLKISFVIAAVAAIAWYALPDDLKDYATGFDAKRENIRLRYESIGFALDEWRKDPLLGTGVGLRKEFDATNVVLLTLAETGWAGLVALLGIHLAVFRMASYVARRVRFGGAMFSFATLAVALLAGRFAHGLVDHYWSRGPITVAWAAVGLATLAYRAVRLAEQRRRLPARRRRRRRRDRETAAQTVARAAESATSRLAGAADAVPAPAPAATAPVAAAEGERGPVLGGCGLAANSSAAIRPAADSSAVSEFYLQQRPRPGGGRPS